MGGKAEGGLGVGVQAGQSGVAGIQQKIACLADAAAQGYDLRRKNGVEGNNAGAKLVHILGKHGLRRSIAAAGAGNQIGRGLTAGYANLFTSTPCCQETRAVYLLLGDPLTPVMLWAPQLFYLPLVRK